MLYLLTQHAQWNRKHSPFLLCSCTKGEGVRNNENHVCKLITSNDQKSLYNNSEKVWNERSYYAKDRNKKYSKKDHMDWADRKSKGITHFGVSPDLLPRESIRFDTFHLKCAITRRLMDMLRIFLLLQGSVVRDKFMITVLESFNKVVPSSDSLKLPKTLLEVT